MLGTIVNTTTILTGSIIGSRINKGIKEEHQQVMFNAMGLAAFGLGINSVVQNMPNSAYPVLFIISLAVGSLVGELLDIDGRFKRLTDRFSGGNSLAQGLSTGILLFCVGTLSILGPIQSTLYGDNTYLFTNATLDFFSATVLASTYGIGMCAAAIVLFCWQGAIYLCAGFLGPFLSQELLTEISVIGGFLIASSGMSILNVKQFKTMNMLPCLLVPPVWFLIKGVIGL